MCSVIGVYFEQAKKDDLRFLKNVILQSKIRGLHATGLSYVKNNKVYTISEPVSADKFLDKHDNFNKFVNEDGNLYLIAHCRYSTSDLEDNQPIQISDDLAIVHNGVITQDAPENWLYKTTTKNDSELINLCVLDNKEPLTLYGDASMAGVELHADKTIKYYRNGKRPLYKTKLNNGYILTSTKNIVKRCNEKLTPCVVLKKGFSDELQLS